MTRTPDRSGWAGFVRQLRHELRRLRQPPTPAAPPPEAERAPTAEEAVGRRARVPGAPASTAEAAGGVTGQWPATGETAHAAVHEELAHLRARAAAAEEARVAAENHADDLEHQLVSAWAELQRARRELAFARAGWWQRRKLRRAQRAGRARADARASRSQPRA